MPAPTTTLSPIILERYFPTWHPFTGDIALVRCDIIKNIITDVRSVFLVNAITDQHILEALKYLGDYNNNNEQDTYQNEPMLIKQEVINILGLHETIHFLMNFYNSVCRDELIQNFSKTQFTAIKILYEIQNLIRIEASNNLANIESIVIEISNLYVGYKLFKFIDDAPAHESNRFVSVYEALSSRNAYIANDARHNAVREANDHAIAYFRNNLHNYQRQYVNKFNYYEIAKEILCNTLSEEQRKSYKSYTNAIEDYRQANNNAHPTKEQMVSYITSLPGRFPAIKTLSEKLSKKHKELLVSS